MIVVIILFDGGSVHYRVEENIYELINVLKLNIYFIYNSNYINNMPELCYIGH